MCGIERGFDTARVREELVKLPIRRRTLVVAILPGLLSGVGGFTFHYAEGFSYFSTDPKACANCHIMWPEYDSWSRSTIITSPAAWTATCRTSSFQR
jgi:hypothetical protein